MLAHIDADAFFASVLQRKHPKLRGRPLLALGMGGGCVIAASYEAKAKGVRTGMRLVEARALCPGAAEMPSDFEETAVASRQIAAILGEQCPVLEQMSVDEWFLDLRTLQGGVPREPESWARNLQRDVLRRVGISVSVGAAPSKLLAKMAGEYRKPAGVTVLAPAGIEAFLKDRPAAAIPGIGRRRSLHAEAHRWVTAWDIAAADKEEIARLFGKPGRDMQLELLGHRVSEVKEDRSPPKSVSRCRSFRATGDGTFLFSSILDHLSYTVLKMRRHGLTCGEMSLWLRDGVYNHEGRIVRLPQPMDTEEQMLPYMRQCFRQLHAEVPRCTQTGLALSGLRAKGALQYSLFEDAARAKEGDCIQEKLDELHGRFGRSSVLRASALPTKKAGGPHLNVLA